MPGTVPPGLVEHALTAAWPGASVTRHPVTAPLPPHATVVHGGCLRLAAPEWFPLHTGHEVDPLRPLLEVAAHLGNAESLCVQVLARPATGRRLRPLRHAARRLRTGPPGPLPGFAGRALREVLDLLLPTPQPHAGTSHPRTATDPMLLDDLRLVRDKAAQPQWETTVRYAVATTDTTPTDHRRRLRGVCDEVASAFAEYTGRNRYDRRRLRHPARVLSGRTLRRGDLLSVTELAALAHLPHTQDVPGLDRAGARAVPPRPRVPATGKVLGDTDAGVPRPVALSVPDARHHVQVIGSTGSGKSTLLAHMILDDVTARRGVLVIDPKGDLVVDLLTRLPADAGKRVVLFDPDDHGPHPALNVLAGPETRCTRHFGDHVRPDGYGRWTDNGTTVERFLEYDFGTEDLGRLAAKLTGYEPGSRQSR
jgi:Replication-relaxation/Helicase HerA, central domain